MNLNQVTVPSLDVSKSIDFYKSIGLVLIVEALPKYARFELPKGEATFSIHKVEKLGQGEQVIVYFEDASLDQLVSQLQKKGIAFDSLPEDKTWGWREAHLYDPDGNKLILYKAGKNRKYPPWRLE
ncbi:MAG: VOC family protein [Gilvibacter sp.]